MKICSLSTCNEKHYANSLCHKHYMREYRRMRKKSGTYEEGYAEGLHIGRTEVALAVTTTLDQHGVSCYVYDNALHLSYPGKSLSIPLDGE